MHKPKSDRLAYKIRREREVKVADADALAAILAAAGLQPSFRYEKYRTTYTLPQAKGLKVELDETPVGDFIELEGSQKAIDRAAGLLGWGPSDYITKSYGLLWLERNGIAEGGEAAGLHGNTCDMLF